MVRKLLILFVILVSFNLIFADECGGDVKCKCGDTLARDYIFKENLICNGTALKFKYGLNLDCNGFKIVGNSSGNGLELYGGVYGSTIKNCFISNFSNGIYFNKKYIGGYNYVPKNNKIFNNIFKNNGIGVYYKDIYGVNSIYSNKFVNNNDFGIQIFGKGSGNFWNNSFYKTGIYYDSHSFVEFCNNGFKNNYFTNAIGPECNCLIPFDNFKIERNINFCDGIFYLPNGVGIYTSGKNWYKNININCQNTVLIGNGSNSGITLAGVWDGSINNCNIENYETGITLKSGKYVTSYSIHIIDSLNAKISNNSILNVLNGIEIESGSNIGLNLSNNISIKSFDLNESNIKIYLDVNLQPSILDNVIEFFLVKNIGKELIVRNKDDADLIINIGDFNKKYFFDKFFPVLDSNPYSAKMISNQTNIEIFAKGTTGYILSVKELIRNFDKYKNINNEFTINDSNIEAIGIYDYLTNKENKKYYNRDLNKFGFLVNNILDDKTFNLEESDILINLNSTKTKYRIWHLSSNKSNLLKSYIDKDKFPIVFAGGLWSDIRTWEKLGKELANEGFEVYLLELTGGEDAECDDCYNYFYHDLVEQVYPSYINYVLNDSKSQKIKYVGHSNGARVAVDSLSFGNVNSSVIDTLVLVGVPGAFEGTSLTGSFLKIYGDSLLEDFKNNKTHISQLDIGFNLLGLNFINNNLNKISLNLFKKYLDFIKLNNDLQPGENLNTSSLLMIKGDKFVLSDIIVPVKDLDEIFDNIDSRDKELFSFDLSHMGIVDSKKSQNIIKKKLKNVNYSKFEVFNYLEKKNGK